LRSWSGLNRRRILLSIAAGLAALSIILAVSGGFRTTVGGLRISARSPIPIAVLALINATLWLSVARRANAVAADLEAAWQVCERHSKFVLGIALTSAVLAGVFATRSAAGADASGYLSQAGAWTQSPWPPHRVEIIAQDLPEADHWLTTPLGWRPADGGDMYVPGAEVPTYPPGLPLLMAIPHAIAGVTGASALVIATAGIAIIATGLLTFQLGGSIAAVIAAALFAFTPVFLYQSIQPMSDVPVTAAWMMCFLFVHRKRPAAAGIACALAVMIRPNLAPLAIVPLVMAERRVTFAVPVAVAAALLAALQMFWYGSPIRSGYGDADELFALTNVVPNASRHFRWLIGTAPALLLGIFGAVRLKANQTAQGLLAFALLVIASYLVYAVFDDWSYLRFMLPAMAVFTIFAAVELAAWIDRRPVAVRPLLLFAVVMGVTAHALWVARSLDTFKLAEQLRRVSQVADLINEDVPPAAVIVSGEQSGAMRYYTDRPILRWEAATPESLTTAMATLEQSRRPVYIVLDAFEDGLFRSKFQGVPAGALDWPPILDAGTSHRTRLWKLGDRDRFLRGENLSTIRLP
jgi:hypothetical protein